MKLWAVQQRNGDVMLTALEPSSVAVRGAGFTDWYVKEGDPIGVRNLCAAGFEKITGIDAKTLTTPKRVQITGGLAEA